ncbi:phytanoyl-CoA dioxygenase family protein [Phenylobacterium aquaticum]|uniref:phytanoyl-CoA dioxygenase family protein n=1 Tax=Phenylobacterium aquaticum TaxID=1763816 RepID=UPI0026EC5DBC|nr:phytanoyl-CoA dioxygenase family protein [Phenylobacterium aquaticum]
MDGSSRAFDIAAHEARLRTDGYTIIEDFIDAGMVAAARAALAPHLGSHLGRNSFEGLTTERVYTLVARGQVFERLTEEARLLALLDRFLQPGYLLTASQAICIYPGEAAQQVHFDDGFYRQPRPRPSISLSLIGAIDAFTAANGATEVIPGSHLWSSAEVTALTPERAEALLRPVIMPAGAALIFQGALMHRGGANRSAAPRLAYTNQYCEPWGRTQENFYLGIPREMAAAMSPRLQTLLGYEIWPPFMGQVTASHPRKALEPGWVAPVAKAAASTDG